MSVLNATMNPLVSVSRPASPVLDTRQLFLGRREINIDHGGVRYRLRITRRNKLILQK